MWFVPKMFTPIILSNEFEPNKSIKVLRYSVNLLVVVIFELFEIVFGWSRALDTLTWSRYSVWLFSAHIDNFTHTNTYW